MIVTIIFLAVMAAIAGWWLLHAGLTAKPWLEEGVIGEFDGTGADAAAGGEDRARASFSPSSARCSRCSSAPISCAWAARTGAPSACPPLLWFNTGL